MSRANQDIVRRAIEEVWNRGNLAAIPDLFASEFVTFEPSNQGLRGHEAFARHVTSYRAAYPNLQFAIEALEPTGDEVSVHWKATGMGARQPPGHAASSNASSMSGLTIFHLASGKIVDSWVHWDTAGMLQGIGASSGAP